MRDLDTIAGRRPSRPAPAGRVRYVALFGILLAAGGVFATAGYSIWPLSAAVILSFAAGVARFAGWGLGAASGIVVPTAALAWCMRIYHRVGLTVAVGDVLLLSALGAAALVLLAVGPRPIRIPRPDVVSVLLPASVIPLLVGGFFACLPFLRGGAALSWAMHNDAVWNLVTARFLLVDRGLVPSLHPNSSPLTAELLAAGIAPGRSGVDPADYLQHDVVGAATVLALSTVLVSLVAGVVTAWAIPVRRPLLRAMGAVLGSALMVSWFVAGFCFQLGFYNVMPSLTCLLVAWLAYLRGGRRPIWSFAVLVVAGTGMLALWAPLALVPVVLAGIVAVRRIVPGIRTLSRPAWAAIALVCVQLAAYTVLFSVPDLRRDQQALGAPGASAPVTPALLFTTAGILVALSVAGARTRRDRWAMTGAVATVLALAAGYAYLGMQQPPERHWWGYYSSKLTWLGAVVLIVIAVSTVLRLISTAKLGRWTRVGTTLGAVIALASTAAGVVPRPTSVSALVPYAGIARGTAVSANDTAVTALFALSDPRTRNLVAQYSTPQDDHFINAWLLGLQVDSSKDPIREWSYWPNEHDHQFVCGAAASWGGGVTVHTGAAELKELSERECPDVDATVVLKDQLPEG